MAEPTPMKRQYNEAKERYPDCLLFFRLGDFYEMFDDDAVTASRELDLTLTTRDRNKPEDERTPMCGVPYHSADAYIARLIAKGYKVAICEQVEDAAEAKGLVDREVVRVVTPGTVINSSMLDEGRNNYICSVYEDPSGFGLALCDISTGEFSAFFFLRENGLHHLLNELGSYSPREAVLSDLAFENEALREFLQERLGCRCENGGEAPFAPDSAADALAGRLRQPPAEASGPAALGLCAAGGLLAYLYETQKADLSHISSLCLTSPRQSGYMELDLNSRRNLELTETLRGKETRGSLLWVLDRTKTPMGRRLIRSWTERPLTSPVPIRRR